MQGLVWYALSLAESKIGQLLSHDERELIAQWQNCVSHSVQLTQQYDSTWNSIHWNSSSSVVKKRVQAQLAQIAWDVADSLQLAMAKFNQVCDDFEASNLPITSPKGRLVLEIKDYLSKAWQNLNQFFGSQISSRQLELELAASELVSTAFPEVQQYTEYWDERPEPAQPTRRESLAHRAQSLWKTLCGQQLELDLKSVTPKPTLKQQLLLLLAHLTYRPARKVAKLFDISQNRRKSSLLENIRQEIKGCGSNGLLQQVMEKMRLHLSDTLIEAVAEPAW